MDKTHLTQFFLYWILQENENQTNKTPKGPKFSLVARTKLRLEDVNAQIKTHDMEMEKGMCSSDNGLFQL